MQDKTGLKQVFYELVHLVILAGWHTKYPALLEGGEIIVFFTMSFSPVVISSKVLNRPEQPLIVGVKHTL